MRGIYGLQGKNRIRGLSESACGLYSRFWSVKTEWSGLLLCTDRGEFRYFVCKQDESSATQCFRIPLCLYSEMLRTCCPGGNFRAFFDHKTERKYGIWGIQAAAGGAADCRCIWGQWYPACAAATTQSDRKWNTDRADWYRDQIYVPWLFKGRWNDKAAFCLGSDTAERTDAYRASLRNCFFKRRDQWKSASARKCPECTALIDGWKRTWYKGCFRGI